MTSAVRSEDQDTQRAAPPPEQSRLRKVLTQLRVSAVSVLVGLTIGWVMIVIVERDPVEAYGALLEGAFGSLNSIAEVFLLATPLIIIGAGLALSFRAGVYNIGAEGQLFVGAVGATALGLALPPMPVPLGLLLIGLAAAVLGAAWAYLPALMLVKLGASEVITTIMLNYIAIFLVSYLLHGPLQDPGSPLARSEVLDSSLALPSLIPQTRVHLGFILALAIAVGASALLWRTPWGLRARAVGLNAEASRSAGVKVSRYTYIVFFLSGGLAGLAGFAEVAGVHNRMVEGVSPGFGFTAIVVALLANSSPLGVVLAAILFAALDVGASTMESTARVPASVVSVIEYSIVLIVIGRAIFEFKVLDRIRARLGYSTATQEST